MFLEKAEDGTAKTSIENCRILSAVHQGIVAIIHAITPQKEQVTKIFFADGKTHTAFGFRMGAYQGSSQEYMAAIGAFILTIQSIWGINVNFNLEDVYDKGFGEDVKEAFEKQLNVVYLFVPTEETALRRDLDSAGMSAFIDCIEILKEEQNDVREFIHE